MKKTWEEIKTQTGKSENASWLVEMPRGPYFLVPQHEEEKFLKSFYTMIHEALPELQVKLGYATYAIDIATGMPMKVAYYYDTSD